MELTQLRRKRTVKGVALLLLAGIGISTYLLFREKFSPRGIVVSTCNGTNRRISTDFGTQFALSENGFSIKTITRDMPPGRFYIVSLSDTFMVIGRDDGIWPDLKNTFPSFSRPIKKSGGGVAGTDHWGYRANGLRWRYISLKNGDAVGYRPAGPAEADLFDKIIGSACFSDSQTRPSEPSNIIGHASPPFSLLGSLVRLLTLTPRSSAPQQQIPATAPKR
jgi:hypothetical protein